METVKFNKWNCVRLANKTVELIITRDVGPRVARFAFIGGKNLFAEVASQQGGKNEKDFMVRGGHRFWIAPEAMPWSYEPDNVRYELLEEIPNGVRVRQAPGPVTNISKQMEITLAPNAPKVSVRHTLKNCGSKPVFCAPWALSVMAPNGQCVIPMPKRIPHTDRLTHNQQWSLWGYTNFADPRFTLGSRYVFLRQDPSRGPNKFGIAHEEKWVAYQLDGNLFVKYFDHKPNVTYPDGGCSFETFTNEDFLEVESLGPLVTLEPGASTHHDEVWKLFKDVPLCDTDADADAKIRPLV